jgi:hypothetical protein
MIAHGVEPVCLVVCVIVLFLLFPRYIRRARVAVLLHTAAEVATALGGKVRPGLALPIGAAVAGAPFVAAGCRGNGGTQQ